MNAPNAGDDTGRAQLLADLARLTYALEHAGWEPLVSLEVARLFPTEDLPELLDATRARVLRMAREQT